MRLGVSDGSLTMPLGNKLVEEGEIMKYGTNDSRLSEELETQTFMVSSTERDSNLKHVLKNATRYVLLRPKTRQFSIDLERAYEMWTVDPSMSKLSMSYWVISQCVDVYVNKRVPVGDQHRLLLTIELDDLNSMLLKAGPFIVSYLSGRFKA